MSMNIPDYSVKPTILEGFEVAITEPDAGGTLGVGIRLQHRSLADGAGELWLSLTAEQTWEIALGLTQGLRILDGSVVKTEQGFICVACSEGRHDECPQGTWCDCQHDT